SSYRPLTMRFTARAATGGTWDSRLASAMAALWASPAATRRATSPSRCASPAEPMRLGRRYHVAAQHEELRLLRTGQPWDHALHDPALPHLGLADAGILGGDDNVAPQRQFQTAAQAVPMDARDQQLLAVPHAELTRVMALEGLPPGQHLRWIFSGSEIGARAERSAVGDKCDGRHLAILIA